ncbi:MAG: hypothetical protein Q8P25_00575 [Candidatus Curtissbacteria bacterium]|nr:hypothetical protein [Candidatus Curtissbacteria bacterium]
MMEITKGSIMCWFALPQEKPAQFLEYEEPGTLEVGGKQIPGVLWQMINQLENGQTDNTAIRIVDIGEEI